MQRAGFGIVLNVASTASLQPAPFMATYGATKAFVLSFSEALHEELKGSGITVTALLPGNTETEFHAKVGESDGQVGKPRTSAQVVETGIQAEQGRKAVAIDGIANIALGLLARTGTRGINRAMAAQLLRKGI
jgi:hypothetical protein